jgi:acyl transferase domain-containing protein
VSEAGPSRRKRIALVCPGRGTYTKSELGTFTRPAAPAVAEEIRAMVTYADEVRAARGDLTLSELDGAAQFSSKHVAGENAGALIFTGAAADALRIDRERFEVVAVLGNSMGWYTALHVGGALTFDDGFRLAETMAGFQRDGVIGGQVIWPFVGDDWRKDPAMLAEVEATLAQIRDAGLRAGWSIRLGGFAVLWGENDAIRELLTRLPKRNMGEREYPFQLQGHSAFHSPLLQEISEKAIAALSDLPLLAPDVPLIDGRGYVWNPIWSDPAELLAYTLGTQVTTTFDFTAAVRVALREFAPDHLVLLGPGDTLGGAIAHVLIAEGWQGITDKAAFRTRQETADPYLIAVARPNQSALISAGEASQAAS